MFTSYNIVRLRSKSATDAFYFVHNYATNQDSILKSRDITLPTKVHLVKPMFFLWSCMDVRVGLWRRLTVEELMLLKCGVGEDSWESLGLLLLNMLSRLVITFLPRSKRLLISWLQSPSAVILEPPKIVETVSDFTFGGIQNHCRWWLQPWN